ncbi:hypothetical protein EV183_004988 [Coemansia sp. RSA 2336]|nr:hypothetical protein EV183_004988 [Coemansia sp. RSA 2336]
MAKKKKQQQPPAVSVPMDESEDEYMSAEDIDFVQQNAESLGFLSSVNPESLSNIKKETKEKRVKRKAKPAVPPPAELTESEDEELVAEDSDSDMEILSESEEEEEDKEEYINSKERRALKRKAMFGDEMSYEQNARSFVQAEKKTKETNKLPIKTADGRLRVAEYSDDDEPEPESEPEPETEPESGPEPESGDSADESLEATPENAESDEDTKPDRGSMSRKEYIITQQKRLATVADAIMQNPEEALGKLKTLQEISEDSDPRVKRLGLLSQLAVFCDILPDYRIRELTEKEKEMRVTKEVRQQRVYEERLVRSYSAYLKQLFTASKRAMKIFSNSSADIETGIVAARALGELINKHPHFNFRKDILSALVDIYVQPSSRINFAPFTPMAQNARLAILRLFRDDVSGEVSQNAVILASKRIKRLSYRVDPSALRPWLHLRLREELRQNPDDRKRAEEEQKRKEQRREQKKLLKRKKGSAAIKEAKRALHMSKKQAKTNKMQQEVDKSMREAEAEVSREERERWYGETLKQVFITYFRILKQKDNIGGLLPAVLEGLAKYAHLISVEFFVDLFQLLKKIMRGQHGVGVGAEDTADDGDLVSSRISSRTSLLCILTALHILTGQGEALNLDIQDFFYQLYALLPPLATNPQIEATRMSLQSDGTRYTVYLTPAEVAAANATADADGAAWEETVRSESDLLFECLNMMFLGRTKVSSITRVAAFCKRVMMAALYWPPRTAVRAIEFVRRLLIKYPMLDRLLSSEEQAGSGLYLRDLDDPDMCNPFATCLYELHWLQIHNHPQVQAAASQLLAFAKAEEKKAKIA